MRKYYSFNSKNWLRGCLLIALALCFSIELQAQSLPVVQWDKTFGGSSNDDFRYLGATSDGGVILGGNSYSDQSGDKSHPSKGDSDYWIIKIDSAGNKLWDRVYGGSGREILWSIQETFDKGFILAGISGSGKSGDKSEPRKGGFWIVKLDSSGEKIWDKTYGGDTGMHDYPSIVQTADGGYFVGGLSSSGKSGDKSEPSRGASDYWVLRLDPLGNKLWDRTFGGSGLEELHSVKQTADGGFILGGSSDSGISGDKTEPSRGFRDYWIVKLDATGNKIWDRTFGGGIARDILYTIQQTADGGYIAGGQGMLTKSGDRTDYSRGMSDYWIVRLDANGNKLWDKAYGGSNQDDMFTVNQTLDGGFVLGGRSMSGISGDKSQPNKGDADFWIVKIDSIGTKQWDLTIGDSGTDTPLSSAFSSDGGLIIGGIRLEYNSVRTKGMIDYCVVKLKGGLGEKTIAPILAKNTLLLQNRPNPFRKSTIIAFELPKAEKVEITILNELGTVISTIRKEYKAGTHEITWEELVKDKSLNPGLYFYNLSTPTFHNTKRMILLGK